MGEETKQNFDGCPRAAAAEGRTKNPAGEQRDLLSCFLSAK